MTTGTGRTRLAALIQARIDTGESLRDIERRANEQGHDISHSHIDKLRHGLVQRAPLSEHMLALAAGLQLPLARIRQAVVMDWFGWDPGIPLADLPVDIRDCIDTVILRLSRIPNEAERRPVIVSITKVLIGTA